MFAPLFFIIKQFILFTWNLDCIEILKFVWFWFWDCFSSIGNVCELWIIFSTFHYIYSHRFCIYRIINEQLQYNGWIYRSLLEFQNSRMILLKKRCSFFIWLSSFIVEVCQRITVCSEIESFENIIMYNI